MRGKGEGLQVGEVDSEDVPEVSWVMEDKEVILGVDVGEQLPFFRMPKRGAGLTMEIRRFCCLIIDK